MDSAAGPVVVVLAGPNGAGKTTTAPALLPRTLGIHEFVNADLVAQGLSGFSPEAVAITAGRIMLERLKELARGRRSFAFETTLASRAFAPWIAGLQRGGYRFELVFLWLPSAELALSRVASRVLSGGHDVAAEVVRRRWQGGLTNLARIYLPMADVWRVYDSSERDDPELIARGRRGTTDLVVDEVRWRRVRHGGGKE